MRRTLPFLLILSVLPEMAVAQSPDWSRVFYLGFGGVLETSPNSQIPGYGMGSGFDVVGGYSFDNSVALQMKVNNFYYYGSDSNSIYMLRPLAGVKLSLDLKDYFQPYLFLGPGMNLSVFYTPYQVTSSLSFVLSAGAGVRFDLGSFALYAEGEYDYLFQNGIPAGNPLIQSFPLEIGFLSPL